MGQVGHSWSWATTEILGRKDVAEAREVLARKLGVEVADIETHEADVTRDAMEKAALVVKKRSVLAFRRIDKPEGESGWPDSCEEEPVGPPLEAPLNGKGEDPLQNMAETERR